MAVLGTGYFGKLFFHYDFCGNGDVGGAYVDVLIALQKYFVKGIASGVTNG